MKKFGLLFLLLVLAACSTETATEPVTTDTAVNEPADTPLDFSPATTVAEAAVVRDRDYVLGSSDPAVVIIEYGDFQ